MDLSFVEVTKGNFCLNKNGFLNSAQPSKNIHLLRKAPLLEKGGDGGRFE
jgi:hypothetical protein